MSEAWITVLSCRSRNISQKGRSRLKRSKKVSYKTLGLPTQTHTLLSGLAATCCHPVSEVSVEGWGRMIRRKNVLSLDSVQKEDGRRFDRFYVIICTNAMQFQVQFIIYFLPVASGFHFYTHAFRSLFRICSTQCTARL
jgi:hypothetical protein